MRITDRLNPLLLLGIVIAGGALLAYATGLLLHDGSRPGCDTYVYCSASERDIWATGTGAMFVSAFRVGLLLAWTGLVWRPIGDHPRLRLWGSVAGLLLCVPSATIIAVWAVYVYGNTCDGSAWLCFGGPADARAFAVIAAVPGLLSLLLLVGLVGHRSRVGRASATFALTAISGAAVVAAGSWAFSRVLG